MYLKGINYGNTKKPYALEPDQAVWLSSRANEFPARRSNRLKVLMNSVAGTLMQTHACSVRVQAKRARP